MPYFDLQQPPSYRGKLHYFNFHQVFLLCIRLGVTLFIYCPHDTPMIQTSKGPGPVEVAEIPMFDALEHVFGT